MSGSGKEDFFRGLRRFGVAAGFAAGFAEAADFAEAVDFAFRRVVLAFATVLLGVAEILAGPLICDLMESAHVSIMPSKSDGGTKFRLLNR